MEKSIMQFITEYYRTRHQLLLNLVDRLDDEQVKWSANSTAPSIAFHVWHLARWADFLQAVLTAGAQIWDQDGFVVRWGFESANSGVGGTGLGIDESVLARLPFPHKEILLDYARRAFAQADQAVSKLGDGDFHRRIQEPTGEWGQEPLLGDMLLSLMSHASRHLGMIEALVGVQGLPGTATE